MCRLVVARRRTGTISRRCFTLLEGELEFTFRGKTSSVCAGSTVNIPANAPHDFKNASGAAVQMLSMATLEEFFLEVGDLRWARGRLRRRSVRSEWLSARSRWAATGMRSTGACVGRSRMRSRCLCPSLRCTCTMLVGNADLADHGSSVKPPVANGRSCTISRTRQQAIADAKMVVLMAIVLNRSICTITTTISINISNATITNH
jgi:Cupin domain